MSYNKALEKILFINIEEQEEKQKEEEKNFINTKTYVIIDAARIKKLTNELIALTSLEYENLFMPHEQEALEEVAPYLIELKKEDDFTQWVYENVYGKLGCIFIHSSQNIEELGEHFRSYITTTTKVPNPRNESELMDAETYVRLYDPRVFTLFDKQVKDKEEVFYSPIQFIYVENSKNEQELHSFTRDSEVTLNLEEL